MDLKLNAIITASSEQALDFLNKIGKSAKENLFSFDAMTALMSGAMKSIASMGVGAVAALTGLAFTSPTVNAALARMKPTLFEISETIGKALKPGLEKAGELLKSFSQWLSENTWFTDLLSEAFEGAVEIVGKLGGKLGELISSEPFQATLDFLIDVLFGDTMQSLIDTFGYSILGVLIGNLIGGPMGAATLGAVGLGLDISEMLWPEEEMDKRIAEANKYTGKVDRMVGGYTTEDIIRGLDIAAGKTTNVTVVINGEQLDPDSVEVNTS